MGIGWGWPVQQLCEWGEKVVKYLHSTQEAPRGNVRVGLPSLPTSLVSALISYQDQEEKDSVLMNLLRGEPWQSWKKPDSVEVTFVCVLCGPSLSN